MRALNVRQPWASLIAIGKKDLEVRSWGTPYRGPVVIVASSRPDRQPLARVHDLQWIGGAHAEDAPLGVSVCVVDLVDIIEGRASHARRTGGVDPTGYKCWVFKNPRSIEQITVRGRLNLWHWGER